MESKQIAVGEIKHRVNVFQVVIGEDIVFLGERGLHRLGGGGHRGASVRPLQLDQWRVQNVIHREEDGSKGLLAMFLLN